VSYYRTIHSDTYLSRFSRRRNVFVRHHKILTAVFCLIGILWVGLHFTYPSFLWPSSRDLGANSHLIERIGIRSLTASARNSEKDRQFVESLRLPFEPPVPKRSLANAGSAWRTPSNLLYPEPAWINITVASGDNLSLVFEHIGANKQDMQRLLDISKDVRTALVNLSPGQILRFRVENSQINEVIFEQDFLNSARFRRTGSRFSAHWTKTKPEVRLASAIARINHSLFIDGQKAGLSDKTIMEFIEVFGWDVDFVRELQRGDQFSVVYEELYKDGVKISNGKILAAEFVNHGKRLRAIFYDNGNGVAGYYSDKGDAMRKAFLRTPVNFTRISSRFSLARRHPILNRIRAHRGVDYSAPTGTPIQAVADGKVSFVGKRGGYGQVIQLKHGETYSTLYGHMSKFAKGIHSGSLVNQGQIIGYVGRTGLATGPHLHFEFLIDGIHRDPLTVKLPNSLALDRKFNKSFLKQTAPLLARLESLSGADGKEKNTLVAENRTLNETNHSSH
jgi:murein DD-endopeptidase MepM/ murein hydrolase activator NlpD